MAGPSEFSTSVTVSVSPDVLAQDGASQSLVTVRAMDANAEPVRNLSLRAEILVGFEPVDFGSLSARNIVTDSSGRATLVYTAPPDNRTGVDTFTIVTIAVTPIGTDFMNASLRSASIRIVPPGNIVPPDGLQPRFTFAPTAPTERQQVFFDATTSQSLPGNPIARYEWEFGDGQRGEGRTVAHEFSRIGSYVVTLTIVDNFNRSASTSQPITVGQGVGPTASFTFSPTAPLPGDRVNFNAVASTAAPGRRIVRYDWDFGDGTPAATGVQTSHTYPNVGTYVVTLTVTDDLGRRNTVSQSVPVDLPDEDEGLTAR